MSNQPAPGGESKPEPLTVAWMAYKRRAAAVGLTVSLQDFAAGWDAAEGSRGASKPAEPANHMREALAAEIAALKDGVPLPVARRLVDHVWSALYIRSTTPEPAPLREALTELVALKDLQYRIDNWDTDSGKRSHVLAMQDEYARRKPLAWKLARAALAGTPTPTPPPVVSSEPRASGESPEAVDGDRE